MVLVRDMRCVGTRWRLYFDSLHFTPEATRFRLAMGLALLVIPRLRCVIRVKREDLIRRLSHI